MRKKYELFFLILSATMSLFLGNNVLQNLGYMIGQEEAPSYQKLHPAFITITMLLLFSICFSKTRNRIVFNKKIELAFLVFFLLLIMFMQVNKLSGALSFIPNTLILPVLFSIILDSSNGKQTKYLKSLIIAFLIINSSIAIIERILVFHLFHPLTWGEIGQSTFRSTALQNHPLNNALITSTIMAFILVSDMKSIYKFPVFFVGLISIVAYGTRSSIIAWIVMLTIYLIYSFLFTSSRNKTDRLLKPLGFLTILFGVFLIYFLIANSSFGQRLIERAYLDDSASVRIEVFQIFNIIRSGDLLWGASRSSTLFLQNAAGIDIIENFWIIWIIRFGLVMFVPLTIMFILFLFKTLEGYKRFDAFFVIITFIGIASTNNSLGSVTPSIGIFVLCASAFLKQKPNIKKTHDIRHRFDTQINHSVSFNVR